VAPVWTEANGSVMLDCFVMSKAMRCFFGKYY